MEILWDRGTATVSDVVDALPEQQALAYSTVLTTLRILEQKGYIEHEKQGRAFVYRPIVDRDQAGRSAVRYVLSRFFDNSPEQLLLNVLEHEEIDPAEMERLKKLVEETQ
jgi:predicted transcriptional regulator